MFENFRRSSEVLGSDGSQLRVVFFLLFLKFPLFSLLSNHIAV